MIKVIWTNARVSIRPEIKKYPNEFASAAFSREMRDGGAVMWNRLKGRLEYLSISNSLSAYSFAGTKLAHSKLMAEAYSGKGSHSASALLYANAARMETNFVEKGKLFALAAKQATLACNLKATLKYDSLAMGAYREIKEYGLARMQGIESGKRYRQSALDPKTKWSAAAKEKLLGIAKYREPDNEGRVIMGSGVKPSGMFYDRMGTQ